jgi:hypothetical protein
MSAGNREMMFFECIFVRESPKAIMVMYKTEDIWLPKSQIVWTECDPGDQTEVQVPLWLARQHSMI